MKNLKLKELSLEEQKNIEGGVHPYLAFAVGAILGDIILDPEGSWDAIAEGFNKQKK